MRRPPGIELFRLQPGRDTLRRSMRPTMGRELRRKKKRTRTDRATTSMRAVGGTTANSSGTVARPPSGSLSVSMAVYRSIRTLS